MGNAIGIPGIALFEQIVVQLAIPIDPAAVAPGLPDQCTLPGIFLRSPDQRRFAPGIQTAGLNRQAPARRADTSQTASSTHTANAE